MRKLITTLTATVAIIYAGVAHAGATGEANETWTTLVQLFKSSPKTVSQQNCFAKAEHPYCHYMLLFTIENPQPKGAGMMAIYEFYDTENNLVGRHFCIGPATNTSVRYCTNWDTRIARMEMYSSSKETWEVASEDKVPAADRNKMIVMAQNILGVQAGGYHPAYNGQTF